jgi:hypothetical protein
VDVASIICPEKEKGFENICLSRRTVVRWIEVISDDIKKSLREKTSRLEALSVALDDSIDTAQLAIFIGGPDADFNFTGELLGVQPLKGTLPV